MEILDLVQGSDEWHQHRATHFNASDAPAMLGVSPYKTRTELLHERHTGIAREIDSATQALFDAGHRYEKLARGLAEEIISEELFPVTGSLGELSASFDGLTMDETIVFEHKSINNEIRSAKEASDLGEHLRVQMEQQLMVSGAGKCLFMASQWDAQGTLIEEVHFWYWPDKALRQRIIEGWKMFKADLAEYVPVVHTEKPSAEPIMQLPALAVQIRGEVVLSNLPQFKERALEFIAGIKTELETDDDFANAEETVKFCDKAEKAIDQAKNAAISQTASIDDLMRTMDHIKDQMRNKRLSLEKLILSKKNVIKQEILDNAKAKFAAHIASLELEINPIRLVYVQPDFAGAMKNKRTLSSMHNAVDTELAQSKITTNEIAKGVRGRLAWVKENGKGFDFLFNDAQQIIYKSDDDFKLLVTTRIADHKKKEDERLSAERAKLEERMAEGVARAAKELADKLEKDTLQAIFQQHTPSNTTHGDTVTISNKTIGPPTLRLGQISERLGFNVTADFLRSLGFEPAGRDKAAMLYHQSTFDEICEALITHIITVQNNVVAVPT